MEGKREIDAYIAGEAIYRMFNLEKLCQEFSNGELIDPREILQELNDVKCLYMKTLKGQTLKDAIVNLTKMETLIICHGIAKGENLHGEKIEDGNGITK